MHFAHISVNIVTKNLKAKTQPRNFPDKCRTAGI